MREDGSGQEKSNAASAEEADGAKSGAQEVSAAAPDGQEQSKTSLKDLAVFMAAVTYGIRVGGLSVLQESSNMKNYSSLAAVFVAGMHANLKKKAARGKGQKKLDGQVLDKIAHKHAGLDIVKDLQEAYRVQYEKLTAADKELARAVGIEDAYLKSAKHNFLAFDRSLKGQVLRSDSDVAKSIVGFADMLKIGMKGVNAGMIKLIYYAGYEAANYVDIEQHNGKIAFAQKVANVPLLGMYIWNQMRKLSVYAADLATVGAAAALDALFEHLDELEKSKLAEISVPGDVVEGAGAAIESLIEDYSVAQKAAEDKLDKSSKALTKSVEGVKDELLKKPHKVNKVFDLQVKQGAAELAPSIVKSVDDITSSGRGIQATSSKLVYRGVKFASKLVYQGVSKSVGYVLDFIQDAAVEPAKGASDDLSRG